MRRFYAIAPRCKECGGLYEREPALPGETWTILRCSECRNEDKWDLDHLEAVYEAAVAELEKGGCMPRPTRIHCVEAMRRMMPAEVKDGEGFAVTLVAVTGLNGDWACYAGDVGVPPEEIAEYGDKVTEEGASFFSHVMCLRGYRD